MVCGAILLESRHHIPVAQLGERRLARKRCFSPTLKTETMRRSRSWVNDGWRISAKSEHCSDRSERAEPAGEGPGPRFKEPRGAPAARSAAFQRQDKLKQY